MSEAAETAQCDATKAVDFVFADPEVGGRFARLGLGFESGVEDDQRCAAGERGLMKWVTRKNANVDLGRAGKSTTGL